MNNSCLLRCLFILSFLPAINGFSQTFKSEGDFKKYFTQHADSLDSIEGIWNVKTSQEFYNSDALYDNKSFSQTVAVLKKDSIFLSYDMKGGAYNVSFSKTEVNKVYLFRIFLTEINQNIKANAVISAGKTMEYKYEFPEEYLQLIFKDTFEKGGQGGKQSDVDQEFSLITSANILIRSHSYIRIDSLFVDLRNASNRFDC